MAGTPEFPPVERWPWWPTPPRAWLALVPDRPDLTPLVADPGPALLILAAARTGPADFRLGDLWADPHLCADAAAQLGRTPAKFFGPPADTGRNRSIAAYALAAAEIARRSGRCSPIAAALAARLVGVGELAAERAGMPLTPADADRLGRRLLVRWGVPNSWAASASSLDLDPADAARLGADAGVHAVLREAQRNSPPAPAVRGDQPSPELVCRLLIGAARLRLARRREAAWREQAEALDAVARAQRRRWADELQAGRIDGLAEFAAGASHEINNPLAIISGNAQMLRAGEPDPDRRRRLDAIVRSGQRVHDILAGARQFARPSPPAGTTIEVGALFEQVVRTVAPTAGDCDVELRTEVLAEGFTVVADAAQARRALEELARNAIAAAGAGGWVRFGATATPAAVGLTVEDSGPGPRPEDVPHLYDPFYSGRDAGRGRGLGLSIAWRLAQLNGGSVRYEPRAGRPGRFVLALPEARPERRAG